MVTIERDQPTVEDGLARERQLDKTTVLIVDDSAAVRDGLRSILRANPAIEVLGEAADGLAAIASVEELQPDVVLMDAQMPQMDGMEATRRIKARWPDIKVLLLTVHTEFIEAAVAAGADAYLLKDSGREELRQVVRELGRRNQT